MNIERLLAGGLVSLCAFLGACGGGSGSGGGEASPAPTELPATVTVNAAPAEVDASTAFGTNVTALNSGLKFQWAFGDGGSSADPSPTHVYAAAGKYDVTLTVTNEVGTTRTASFAIVASRMAMVQDSVCSGALGTGWCWQRPKPLGGAILDMYFHDAALGWAVGDAGQILKTTDGGVSWVGQHSGVTARLTQIRFSDASNGWAVGDSATILRSTDGGSTWLAQASGVAGASWTYGASLRVLSASQAVVTFASYQTRTTVDGGEHWNAGALNPTMTTPNGTLWALSYYELSKSTDMGQTAISVLRAPNSTYLQMADFADDLQGWVLVYDYSAYPPPLNLWRTVDGGISWSPLSASGLPASVSYLKFSANGKGWAIVYDTIYRTDDAGSSWTPVVLPPGAYLYGYIGYFEALDGDTLWFSANNGAYLTRDRGVTWTFLNVTTETNYSAMRLQQSPGAIWLHYGQRSYRSADGGASWQRIFGPDIEDQGGNLLAMWFFDGKKGLAYSSAGWMVETGDSGRTWTRKALTGTNSYSAAARLQFTSATTGWLAANQSSISKTTDGGASWWTPLSAPDFGYLNDFHFIDANLGWAVGSNGTISSSQDGAQTWVKQATLPYGLRGVRFISPSIGVVVGDGGIIARSSDGGAHWSLRASSVTADLKRVMFVDASVGWAVGQSGTVTKTSDGGVSWSRVAVPSSASLNDVFFLDAQRGWIVGSGGTVLATIDGGNSWQLQRSPTDKTLNAAFFVDSRTGWLTGDGGSILATATGGN